LGAAFGGVGGGLLWTSQGSYYTSTSIQYALLTKEDETKVKSYLSSVFAGFYLGIEAFFTFLATVIYLIQISQPKLLSHWKTVAFTIYSIAAMISAVLFQFLTIDIEQSESNTDRSNSTITHYPFCSKENFEDIYDELLAVSQMICQNFRLQLLIPYQVCFGLTSGMTLFYVNRMIITKYLGDGYIGVFTSVAIISAAILTWPQAVIGYRYKYGKQFIMILGILFFFINSSTVFIFPDSLIGNWPALSAYYVIRGAGRSVWETTNKAVIADYFVTPIHRQCAFAAVYFTSGLAGAFGYLAYLSMNKSSISGLNTVVSIIAMICYCILIYQPVPSTTTSPYTLALQNDEMINNLNLTDINDETEEFIPHNYP
jgi:hypothetical protein